MEQLAGKIDPARIRGAQGRHLRAALVPLAPAVIFLLVVFVFPIAAIFYYAVDTGDARAAFPRTRLAIASWSGADLPDAQAYQALVEDLRGAFVSRAIYPAARELNNRMPGFRSIVISAGRQAQAWPPESGREALLAVDPVWGSVDHWRAISSAVAPFTAYRLLAALDLRPQWNGLPVAAPVDQRIYVRYLGRTLWICAVVTVYCLVLGYPLAYLIATTSPSVARWLLTLTLLPFWTSILVRTAAWVVILQQQGVVNGSLQWAGLIEQPLTLIYNRVGVYVVMTHVLLPFMVLPVYSVMKGIPANLLPAAASLGARPIAAFVQVYLPQSQPGIAAGCLMTFILALGYYVTPALVGGATDQMESGLIAHFALNEGNWGMAASLAVILLLVVLLAYALYARFSRSKGLQWA